MHRSTIERTFVSRTPESARLMERAVKVMPGGSTRAVSWHPPYPIVLERGLGSRIWDVDGNEYVDMFYNALSLIHGHAYPPVVEAIQRVVGRGTGFPVATREQIEFAEALCDRLASFERVRFTNSGTEAGMLAVKVARKATGRQVIIKAWAGYHGSYDDLEVGLYGIGPIDGRVLLGEFGSVESFERLLSAHAGEVAAVILEPVMYTGVVTPPPEGFLSGVQAAARKAGALFVLDDCLMLRLAPGGSAEKYGLDPDITFLGKFVGGGTPMGVVGGREEVMRVTDPGSDDCLYHGGSFNGNLVGCAAGKISLEHLTPESIDLMDDQSLRLRSALDEKARALGIPLTISGEGSIMGIYLTPALPDPMQPNLDFTRATMLAVAAQNHGVFIGVGGELAASTALTEHDLEHVVDGLGSALEDVAAALGQATAGARA